MSALAELTLRLARPGEYDPEAAARVVNAAFARYEILRGPRTSPAEFEQETGPDGSVLLAECGGVLAGVAMVRPATAADRPGGDRALYFGLAAVEPAAMSLGIGRRLLKEAEGIAARDGYPAVALNTLREFGLVDYYARVGYRPTEWEDYPRGHWTMIVPHRHCYLRRDLGAPLLRLASAADVPAITALTNRAYRVEEFFVRGDRTGEAEVRTLQASGRFLVLESEGRLAGSVHLAVEGARATFGMLAVDPAQQRRGTGRQLVRAAEQYARVLGATAIDCLVVNLREELPPWYARLGYRETGRAPWPTAARPDLLREVHFIRMSRPLEPALVPAAEGG